MLRDILWYIDGHHHVFQQRSIAILTVFTSFDKYNTPELSKHRKRRTINLSGAALQEFVLDLATVLHDNYWEREGWCELKQDVYTLSQSLGGYVDYLHSKNKMMKL